MSENNPAYCDKISGGAKPQEIESFTQDVAMTCKIHYAIAAEDVDFCLTLPDTELFRVSDVLIPRDACLRSLAMKLNRPDLCELTPASKDEENGQTYLTSCKELVQNYNNLEN